MNNFEKCFTLKPEHLNTPDIVQFYKTACESELSAETLAQLARFCEPRCESFQAIEDLTSELLGKSPRPMKLSPEKLKWGENMPPGVRDRIRDGEIFILQNAAGEDYLYITYNQLRQRPV